MLIVIFIIIGAVSEHKEKVCNNQFCNNERHKPKMTQEQANRRVLQCQVIESKISNYIISYIQEHYKIKLKNKEIEINDFIFVWLYYELFVFYLIYLEGLFIGFSRYNLANTVPCLVGGTYLERMAVAYPNYKSFLGTNIFVSNYEFRHNYYINETRIQVEKDYSKMEGYNDALRDI